MSKHELGTTAQLSPRPGFSGRAWLLPALLVGAIALLLALIPPEKTLGWVIRPVFLHGALVQVGLLAFAAAGLLGLAYFLRRSPQIAAWCLAAQETAVALWIAYALSSMVTTRLAWGEWIAWDEPRVRASVHVLWFCILCLLLVYWMRHPVFTALTNILAAGAVWVLIKGAGLLRHPFDPIGGSNSFTYQAIYWLLAAAVLASAVLLAVRRFKSAKAARSGEAAGGG